MPPAPLLVIGGSAGALGPLRALFAGLPADLAAAVLVVIHRPPNYPSYLASILGDCGPLPVADAEQGAPITPGQAYIAPPNQHLIVAGDQVRLSRGPKENFSRPSIDVLFRSAAVTRGPGVTGLLLSGMLDDGTSGLLAIKHFGGAALVQDPQEAEYPEMPLSALRQVEVDDVVKVDRLASQVIESLSRPQRREVWQVKSDEYERRLKIETGIASEDGAFEEGLLGQGTLSPFSCPECHGVMVRLREGNLLRFRCHTGHAYSEQSLLAGIREQVEAKLWQAVRVLDEDVMLLEHLSKHYAESALHDSAQAFREEARQVRERAGRVRQEALQSAQFTALPTEGEPGPS